MCHPLDSYMRRVKSTLMKSKIELGGEHHILTPPPATDRIANAVGSFPSSPRKSLRTNYSMNMRRGMTSETPINIVERIIKKAKKRKSWA